MNTKVVDIKDASEPPPARRGRAKLIIVVAVLAVGVPLGLRLRPPCPAPPRRARPRPGGPPRAATPPAEMAIYGMETGVVYRRAGFTYRGGSWFEHRDSAVTAVLVKHPRGDLLIDSGFGR